MRVTYTAVLTAGALVGLSATPALAAGTDSPPARRPLVSRSHGPGLLHVGVRLGCPLCADVGVLDTVRVRVRLGRGDCAQPAPPPVPKPPSPKPPSPKPPPRPPSPKPPPKPSPPARSAPRPAAAPPHVARVVPPAAARPASPPAARPAHRAAVPKAAAAPPHRKNPLTTLMVLVVITAVIAAGAGVAFAAAP
jgi:hypothetical protein